VIAATLHFPASDQTPKTPTHVRCLLEVEREIRFFFPSLFFMAQRSGPFFDRLLAKNHSNEWSTPPLAQKKFRFLLPSTSQVFFPPDVLK
jgi:hypothetical protein